MHTGRNDGNLILPAFSLIIHALQMLVRWKNTCSFMVCIYRINADNKLRNNRPRYIKLIL